MNHQSAEIRKRNLWPFGVALALTLFAGGMIALIVTAASNRMYLVADDYYEQELKYQTEIDSLANTRELQDAVQVTVDQARGLLMIQLPPDHAAAGAVEGRIHLYRPSSAKLDQERKLEVDVGGHQEISLAGLESGLWKVRLSWAFNGQAFRADQLFVIPPAGSDLEESG